MKKTRTIWVKYGTMCLLGISIFVIFALNLMNAGSAVYSHLKDMLLNDKPFVDENFEQQYNENFYNRLAFIDMNSMVARAMDQKISNEVIKGDNGKLNFMWSVDYVFDEKIESEKVSKAIAILEHAKAGGADILYVQRPWAVNELPYGYSFDYNKQYDYWCEKISEQSVPVLDFRSELKEEIDFYTTDHHWTITSSVYGAESIVNELNALYDHNLDPEKKYFDLNNYDVTVYENSFLGAEGVRVGKYFAGKDDFEVIVPKFETSFEHRQYVNDENVLAKNGSFYEVFINDEILKDEEYNNKYNAYGYAALAENIVVNNKADNDLKVMLISDSFSRPMFTYFSLCFKETRFLDPQDGRYTDSYVEYIDEYDPDIVVMMFPGDGTFQKI